MKSKFKMYVIVWAAVVVLFNVIVFITPNEVAGMSKFGGAFWVGYAFIMVLFLAQLGIGWYAIKDDLAKTFYNIPLLQISYSTMIVMLVVGVLCMAIPQFPVWLGIIICLLVVVFGGISAALAQTASYWKGRRYTDISNWHRNAIDYFYFIIVDWFRHHWGINRILYVPFCDRYRTIWYRS